MNQRAKGKNTHSTVHRAYVLLTTALMGQAMGSRKAFGFLVLNLVVFPISLPVRLYDVWTLVVNSITVFVLEMEKDLLKEGGRGGTLNNAAFS